MPRPSALAKALASAVEHHPYGVRGGWAPNSSRFQAEAKRLWSELLAVWGAARRDLVDALSPHEVEILSLTARARFPVPECFDVVADLLAVHSPANKGQLAWLAHLHSDGASSFARYAVPEGSGERECDAFWERLRMSSAPSLMAAQAYLTQQASFALWVQMPWVQLSALGEFANLVKRRLLNDSAALARVNLKEQGPTIEQWACTLLTTERRVEWDKLFLSATYQTIAPGAVNSRVWPAGHAVLVSIRGRYGDPDPEHLFWADVPAAVRDAFDLWIRDHVLTGQLGENERVQFWRRFLPYMRESVTNRERTVVFLKFDRWFAVQFKSPGTATYLFLNHDFRRGLLGSSESDLRQFVYGGRAVGSYEHRGLTTTWQSNAARLVKLVQARYS